MDHRFYVGAAGSLVALPDQLAKVDATQLQLGGFHAGLGGGGVLDLQRVLGSWAWSWDTLLPHQVAFVKALHNGLVPGPLRLVDPREANRLPTQFASGGSQRRSPVGAAVSTGSVAHRQLSAAPADPRTLPAASALKGAFAWTVPAAVGGRLGPTRAATVGPQAAGADSPWRVPLLRGDDGLPEQIVLSGWACATLPEPGPGELPVRPLTATLARVDRDVAGVETSLSATRPVVLTSDRWTRVSWTFTPKRPAVDSTPALLVAPAVGSDGSGFETGGTPGSGGGGDTGGTPTDGVSTASVGSATVYVTALQWAAVGAESLPPMLRSCDTVDPAGGWRVGGGAPEVVVAGVGAHGYGLPWFHSVALALREA